MFGYKCEDCGEGTVREETFYNYVTKIKGMPFTVPEAIIGVCDKCVAKYFSAEETKKWETLLYKSPAIQRSFLQPTEIKRLRNLLNLSMENFAFLIGTTRQSIYNWEKPHRAKPQIRMADLMMKLVEKSYYEREVNVLNFLSEEARKLGIRIDIPVIETGESTSLSEAIILKVEQILDQQFQPEPRPEGMLAYSAQDVSPEVTVVKTKDGQQVGKLIYQYSTGNIILEFIQRCLDLRNRNVELVTTSGKKVRGELELIDDKKIILLKNSIYREKQIKEVHLNPKLT